MNASLDISRFGRFSDLPRSQLYEGTTAIERLRNLAALTGPSRLYVKRDDCNHLAFGGNKVRQIEYYFGDALAKGADTVLITGATQSNFVRIAAASAAKLRMECHVQLESRVANESPHYHASGNVLLDRLLGAKLHFYEKGEDERGADARLHEMATELKAAGRTPYVIPLAPGHKPLGALGYVRAAVELRDQLIHDQLHMDEIYVASGSGSTHAGLLFGLRALDLPIRVVGVCVRRSALQQRQRIWNRCLEIADLLGVESTVKDADIVLTDEHFAPGYGMAARKVWDAIVAAAQLEALLLDPTYTGKVMVAFLEGARSQETAKNLLFLHTGGSPAIFGYQDQYERILLNQKFCFDSSKV